MFPLQFLSKNQLPNTHLRNQKSKYKGKKISIVLPSFFIFKSCSNITFSVKLLRTLGLKLLHNHLYTHEHYVLTDYSISGHVTHYLIYLCTAYIPQEFELHKVKDFSVCSLLYPIVVSSPCSLSVFNKYLF